MLQEYIKTEYHVSDVTKMSAMPDGGCPWRKPGIKHKKNEIFLDVVEKLNMLVPIKGLHL